MSNEILVFSDDSNIQRRKNILIDLINRLNQAYQININCSVTIGSKIFPQYNLILHELINLAKNVYGYIDINWIYALNWYTNQPSDFIIDYYLGIGVEINILYSFFNEIKEQKFNYPAIQTSAYYFLSTINLKNGQGPYGTTLDVFPKGVAIDTTGYQEVIFHEFLHLFGVSEGYGKNHKTTCDTNCWMQWDAVKGKELCDKHQLELKKFISNRSL